MLNYSVAELRYNKKLTIKCITKLKAYKNTSIVYKIETDKE